ncbi:hypothetical protein EYF80_022136 [Liparis tanakae]|uniref:Uncharacterized protein n=1 Tax=Liparis tanakae TaxID=230148 RepID=A0A4Z2HS85_9TELE|nr:hypothetical protein EYF80_022136 [Liparis tanakae]
MDVVSETLGDVQLTSFDFTIPGVAANIYLITTYSRSLSEGTGGLGASTVDSTNAARLQSGSSDPTAQMKKCKPQPTWEHSSALDGVACAWRNIPARLTCCHDVSSGAKRQRNGINSC